MDVWIWHGNLMLSKNAKSLEGILILDSRSQTCIGHPQTSTQETLEKQALKVQFL